MQLPCRDRPWGPGCQNPDFRTPVWLDRQRSSSVSALLRRHSSGSSASGNSSVGSFGIWNVSTGAAFSVLLSGCSVSSPAQAILPYGMYMECLHSAALLFSVVDSLEARHRTRMSSLLLSRSRSISSSRYVFFFVAFLIAVDLKLKVCRYSFGRSAVLRMCEGRSVERDNRLRGEYSPD